jgi:serine/threonine protein phosphatase 1
MPQIPRGLRVYAIGDIHGRADLLQSLFERIDATLRGFPIDQSIHVFLGDYIDRGPNSCGVIEALLSRRRRHSTVFLKGNHESYATQFLNDPAMLPEWIAAGGTSTLLSYGVCPPTRRKPQRDDDVAAAFRQALPESHRRFIAGLAISFTCGGYFFTHAGVRPGIALDRQHEHDLLWIREAFLLHDQDFGKVVVHGHTPSETVDIRCNRINVDTGAYATGRLSCLVLQEDKVAVI